MVLVTSSVLAAIYDLWHYGTLADATMDDLLMGTKVEALEPLFVGLTAVSVQIIMTVRASKVCGLSVMIHVVELTRTVALRSCKKESGAGCT